MELKDTIAGMTSDDYKERFKAEYQQLKIRHKKLSRFISCIALAEQRGEEPPKHDCPLSVLRNQKKAMTFYLDILGNRAKIENISLN